MKAESGFPLPSRTQTHLLRALVLYGAEAGRAWERWLREVGDPLNAARSESTDRYRALLPLAAIAAEHENLRLTGEVGTAARTALLREELRHRGSLAICDQASRALAAAGLATIASSGPLSAERFWPIPGARHSEGPRLVLSGDDLAAAHEALAEVGFRGPHSESGSIAGPVSTNRLTHTSGLRLVISASLVDLPMDAGFGSEVVTAAETLTRGDLELRVPSAAHELFAVLAGACLSGSRSSLLWVVDAARIAEGLNDRDWEVVGASAGRARYPLPIGRVLGYLRDDIGVELPGSATEPREQKRHLTRSEFESVMAQTRASGKARAGDLVAAAENGVGRVRRALWVAVPTPGFMRRAYRVTEWWRLALLYLRRPISWLSRGTAGTSGAR